jgi:APA family basic amino acid/polyamine antiporter
MEKTGELKRNLGLLAATCIVVGSIIGSGIFKKPALMAGELGSPLLIMLVWVVAGGMTLCGSITNAEIAGLFPKTGGQYFFFTKIYGNFFAFLYGWAIFAVIQTGSIASIAYIFGESFGHVVSLPHFSPAVENSWIIHIPFIGNIFPLADIGTKSVAISLIALLTLINALGVLLGSGVQNALTLLKLVAIGGIIGVALLGHSGSIHHFFENAPHSSHGWGYFSAFIAAMSGAFWAYDGWNNVTFIAGEIKNPQKNLPRSLFLGTLIVIAVYVSINLAYLYVLPIGLMSHSHLVASEMARMSGGEWAEKFVLLAILLSTFGSCNGSLMSSARVYFAMAREKMFFAKIGEVNPRFQTPANSLVLQWVWSSLLVLSGTFDTLTDMLVFVTWIFYAMGALGVFILRKKMPSAERPYKVWGYPYIPILFIIFAVIFLGQTLWTDISNYVNEKSHIINSVFGLALVSVGIPFYFYFREKQTSVYKTGN